MMQKNHRDFTVGEILDMGLSVEVSSHDLSENDAKDVVRRFEGAKQSVHEIREDLKVVRAWSGRFKINLFIEGAD